MPSDEIRNVAIVGHKAAGKTSLVEAMLFIASVTPKLGGVGERASGLDDTPEEKSHVATLESRVVNFGYGGKKINVVDTPGEASFMADTRLALGAVDAAIVVVSAKDGIQTGTERLFRWVEELKLPCFVVLTKADDENTRIDEIVSQIRTSLRLAAPIMEVPVGSGPDFKGVVAIRTGKAWVGAAEGPKTVAAAAPADAKKAVDDARAKLVDDVAATDDALTELYLNNGDLTQDELDQGTRKAVADGKMVPIYLVASTQPRGILGLLEAIVDIVPPPRVTDAPLAAVIFKTHIDQHAGRISYTRVVSGTLRADSQIFCAKLGQRDRIAQLQQGTPKEPKPVAEAHAGDIVAATKMKLARTGETLCDEKTPRIVELPERPLPLFSRALLAENRGAEEKIAASVLRIAEEDPGLSFNHDETTRDMLLSGLGAAHLEITVERLKKRAGIDVRLGPPRIPYRETITRKVTNVEGKQKKQSGGHGQFGVCYIDLEPLPRGSGFVFEDAVVGGSIPRQFIPSVEKGIVKAMARGIIAGYTVVDLKVRLFDGKYHSVDSSDAAFQVAGSRAIRAAMVGAHPAILEPLVKLEVQVPSEFMGDVIGDLNSRAGRVLGTDQQRDMAIIQALVPLEQTLDYEPKLTSMTSGRGTFTITPDRYEICSAQTQERVIKDSGFKVVDED
jgi:elongation factor G